LSHATIAANAATIIANTVTIRMIIIQTSSGRAMSRASQNPYELEHLT
jgi:hypothetical protein